MARDKTRGTPAARDKKPAVRKKLERKVPEPFIRRVIRHNIRNRRVQLGFTQADLAQYLGCTQEFVSYIEHPNSWKKPTIYMLAKIAEALGCHAWELLAPAHFRGHVDGDVDLRSVPQQRGLFDDAVREPGAKK